MEDDRKLHGPEPDMQQDPFIGVDGPEEPNEPDAPFAGERRFGPERTIRLLAGAACVVAGILLRGCFPAQAQSVDLLQMLDGLAALDPKALLLSGGRLTVNLLAVVVLGMVLVQLAVRLPVVFRLVGSALDMLGVVIQDAAETLGGAVSLLDVSRPQPEDRRAPAEEVAQVLRDLKKQIEKNNR